MFQTWIQLPELTGFQALLAVSLDSGSSHGNDKYVSNLGIGMLADQFRSYTWSVFMC